MTATQQGRTIRVAVLARGLQALSPCQQVLDRLLLGYAWNGAWHMPGLEVVALYVAEESAREPACMRARKFGFDSYGTVREALLWGHRNLAVEGVIILPDETQFPLPPGRACEPAATGLICECMALFKEQGRGVPVFNYGPVADSFSETRAVLDDTQRLHFDLACGGPLAWTWCVPDVSIERQCKVEAVLCTSPWASGFPSFYLLEALQRYLELLGGVATRPLSVQFLEGLEVWRMVRNSSRTIHLLTSALSRSDSLLGLSKEDGRPQDLVGTGRLWELVECPQACVLSYADGTEGILLMLERAVLDYCIAAKVKGIECPISTQFFVPPAPNQNHFNCLVSRIEDFFRTGHTCFPVNRALWLAAIRDVLSNRSARVTGRCVSCSEAGRQD